MKDTLVLFIAHNVDKFSASQYYKLKKEIPENYDLIWATEDKNKSILFSGPKWYLYSHDELEMDLRSKFHGWVVCPNVVLEKLYEKKSDYKYYYVIEYDVYYNEGVLNNAFKQIDTFDKDFISAYTTDDEDVIKEWRDDYINNFEVSDDIKEYYKSFNGFYRISNAALKFICEYTGDLKKCLYEISYPTILYNNGFTLGTLDTESISKEEFKLGLDIVDFNTYKFENEWYNVDELPKIENKLFTRCKFTNI